MHRRAVFLDRDGVINESIVLDGKPCPPATIDETVLVSDASEALKQLKQLGFLLIVATNQPDVRRGTTSRENVEEIHGFLRSQLPLDDFFVCYHDDRDDCSCRKPLPGLVFQAAVQHEIELRSSYFIGDRWRDIDAGAVAGCRTILIHRSYNERSSAFVPDTVVSSLTEAVDWIVGREVELD
jgi:D-glycero-D-manno-heptose 1,7-bisphosphate phosphatase